MASSSKRGPSVSTISQRIPKCDRCPELREYCATVGREKRKAFADWDYWARPVPGFGDERARIVIVGLAPAAHGANRTGRIFTGDRSGDFLYAALHRAGLANQPESTHRNDGLELKGAYVTAALRCAPPGNKPTGRQRTNCLPWLVGELRALEPRVLLCLGSIGWTAALDALRELGVEIPKPKPKFGHGAEAALDGVTLLGSYHVSQQNTFTGRLTEAMFDAVLKRAKRLAEA
jgi:uracil-DNA glycosylase family 4